MRRATQVKQTYQAKISISIHALLAESDHHGRVNLLGFQNFYPRSPCGERPCILIISICTALFLSTLSLRRATDIRPPNLSSMSISIHALLAESDNGHETTPYRVVISIHALLAESDHTQTKQTEVHIIFLSTLSLRRATPRGRFSVSFFLFLSTLSLRRATSRASRLSPVISISIHALLAESDFGKFKRLKMEKHFYPRSPCGERQNME